jgi:hypothetical protein
MTTCGDELLPQPAPDDPAPDDPEAAEEPAPDDPEAPNEPGNPFAVTPDVPRAEIRCPASSTDMAGGAPAGASLAMTTCSSVRAEEPAASGPCVQAAPLESGVQVQPPGPVGSRLSRPSVPAAR